MSEERLIPDNPDFGEALPFPLIAYEACDSRPAEIVKEASGEFTPGNRNNLRRAFANWSADAGYQNPGFANSGACGTDSSAQAPTAASNQSAPRFRVSPRSCRLINPSEAPASTQANCCFRCVARLALKARRFTNSWSFIVLLFTLLICPVVYLYFGLAYSCPYLSYFNLYFLLKGAFGLTALVTRVVVLIIKKVSDLDAWICVLISNLACGFFWGLHVVEIFAILFSGVLIEEFPTPRECHPVFYYFAMHSQWALPVLGLPLLFLVLLTSYAPSLEIYLN